MFGDIEVQNAAAMVANDEETVEQAAGDGRDGEQIHRRDGFLVVAKKGKPAPARPRIFRHSLHPAGNRSFGNIETEHEKFTVDARSSPGGILNDHLEDQIANHLGYGFPSDGLADLGDQPPVPTESGAMPSDHSFGSDDGESPFPVRPALTNEQPEEPVEKIESRAWMTTFQHTGPAGVMPDSQAANFVLSKRGERGLQSRVQGNETWGRVITKRR
jgi:hypothetical protein